MLRIPVTVWRSGVKVGSKLIEKNEIYKMKQYAAKSCRESFTWEDLDEVYTHVIFSKTYGGMKKEPQTMDIYLDGQPVTEEMFEEITSNSYILDVGAYHRRVLPTFVNESVEKEVEGDKIEETCIAAKLQQPVFYVIKDNLHKKYVVAPEDDLEEKGEDSESLEKASAFDTYEDADEFLSDLQYDVLLSKYLSEEDIKRIIDEEKAFWGDEYEEELKYADDPEEGIIDKRSAWIKYCNFTIIPIYAKTLEEEAFPKKRVKESKEKNISVDFPIVISPIGRIKVNDAKKLLKKLSALQVLKAGTTYFIKDSTGNETCWDFQKSIDPFYAYEFSCEVTDDERDFYNCLYLSKRAGKLDLKNSEWEAHIVESKKRENSLREDLQSTTEIVSDFLNNCLDDLQG